MITKSLARLVFCIHQHDSERTTFRLSKWSEGGYDLVISLEVFSKCFKLSTPWKIFVVDLMANEYRAMLNMP